jgi:hypothetical protein
MAYTSTPFKPQPQSTIPETNVTKELKSVTLPPGLKVWPVKVMKSDLREPVNTTTRFWASLAQEMDGEFVVERFMEVPASDKFSKFHEQNQKNGRAFCVGLFDGPIHDPSDKPDVLTVGFVFDVMKGQVIRNGATTITV